VLDGVPFVGFVPVRDAAAARPFYESTLGLTVLFETPFALVLDANGTMVRVTTVPDLTPQPFTIAGWNVADLVAAVTELVRRGVQFTDYAQIEQDEHGIWTTPAGDRVAWFKDPDGNTLSLSQLVAGGD